METKKYSSYAEIESELEILKLEKEIHFQKMLYNFEKTKECLEPKNLVTGFLGSYKTKFSGSYVNIIQALIPYFINWITNRKRGN
nr:DUF6327 family protein [uncultured Flavobacterium sp.]